VFSIHCFLSASTQLNEQGEFNIDEELENVPPEILEEGHRIIKACQQTRTDFTLFTTYTFLIRRINNDSVVDVSPLGCYHVE